MATNYHIIGRNSLLLILHSNQQNPG